MGNEFGVRKEWNYADSLDWSLLQYDDHKKLQHLIKTLNHLYISSKELSDLDFDGSGFEWIDGSDAAQSCFSFMRKDKEGNSLIIACNFTPVVRYDYKIGVNEAGKYEEIFNSDSTEFGGAGVVNARLIQSEDGWNFKPHALKVTLPPLAVVVYQLKKR